MIAQVRRGRGRSVVAMSSLLVAAWTGDEGHAAPIPPAQVLRLHPLEGPTGGPDPVDLQVYDVDDVPPAGIGGIRFLQFGWQRDTTLKLLFVLRTTPTKEYSRQIVSESALPNPTWAAFETLPIGE